MAYRAPSRWYAWSNRRLGAGLARLGLIPKDVVSLEVVGRSSGTTRRTLVVRTQLGGSAYLVALAGESQWVRDVRAAGGLATLRRRRAHPVWLEEVAVADRAPVLAACLAQAERRGGQRSSARQADSYFGLPPHPTAEEVARIAAYYPVFRVHTSTPTHRDRPCLDRGSRHLVGRGDGDRFFPVGLQRRVARDRRGVEADTIPGGHLLPLVQPRLVADHLLHTTHRP